LQGFLGQGFLEIVRVSAHRAPPQLTTAPFTSKTPQAKEIGKARIESDLSLGETA